MRLSAVVQSASLAWAAIVLVLLVVHVGAPQRSGVIALTQVFEPYLLLSALIAAAVGARLDRRIGRVVAAALVVVFVARCAPVALSNPGGPTANGMQGRVVTWNVASDTAFLGGLIGAVTTDDDSTLIVGIQELNKDSALEIVDDPDLTARFPGRVLVPEDGALGIGLLSKWPIVESQTYTDPPLIRAVIDDPDTDQGPIVAYVVHPLPARIRTVLRVPVSLDTTRRDEDIAWIRSLIDDDLAAGRPIVVVGDINTTEREPAYFELSRGLRDAHLDAGLGPGLTWRPPQLRLLPAGLLRIDYIFVSAPFSVLGTSVTCNGQSDHCRLEAEVRFAGYGVL